MGRNSAGHIKIAIEPTSHKRPAAFFCSGPDLPSGLSLERVYWLHPGETQDEMAGSDMGIEFGRVTTPGQHASGYPNPDDELSVWFEAEAEEVRWNAYYTWDSLMDETKTYCGRTKVEEWLEVLSEEYFQPSNRWVETPEIPGRPSHVLHHNNEPLPYMGREDASTVAASLRHFTPESMRSHCFLDAFSIIENGERSKRYERPIYPSMTTKALLQMANDNVLSILSPRAFEVLVAGTLAELGFKKVTLRRYSKDGGADIIAIVSYGTRDETVVVEVKHSKRPAGLKVLDRLNGVRDRMGADRALLVTSSYVARGADTAYTARSGYLSAWTFRELLAFLKDSPGWESTPHGLWSTGLARAE